MIHFQKRKLYLECILIVVVKLINKSHELNEDFPCHGSFGEVYVCTYHFCYY